MTVTTPGPKDPRGRSRTRPRLLQSARSLFSERGTANVTVEAICEGAGFTRGAFYSNFASIDELLLALYAEHVDELLRCLRSAVQTTLAEGVRRFSVEEVVELVVDALPFDREWFSIRMSFAAQAARHPASADLLSAYEAELRAELQSVLVPALHRAGRRLTVDPDTFTRAVVAGHDGALANSLISVDPDPVRRVVVGAVILGLTTAAPPL